MEVKLGQMTWPEVAEVLEKPHALILPIGSIEQHGHHLPLNVDSRCATYFSEKAAENLTEPGKIHVVVAPCLNYTETSTFGFSLSGYPGTVGLPVDTVLSVIQHVVRDFVIMGFRNILILNGHFGNTHIIAVALRKVHIEFPNAGLYAINWWAFAGDVFSRIRRSNLSLHADELETSVFMVIQPDMVMPEKAKKWEPAFSLSSKWAVPDFYGTNKLIFHSRKRYPSMKRPDAPGVMGDPTVATEQTGRELVSVVVNGLKELITEIVNSEDFA